MKKMVKKYLNWLCSKPLELVRFEKMVQKVTGTRVCQTSDLLSLAQK